MASRPSHQDRKDDVTSTQHGKRCFSNMSNTHVTKVDKKEKRMTLTKKMMLCGQFLGMEATMNFQQIYTVPALQTLGMPLSLTYIIGLVSGPCSILILPPLGWLIDRERHSHRRKFASLVFAATLQIAGLLCLTTANAIHMSYLMDYNTTTHVDTVSGGTLNGSGSPGLDLNVSVSESTENIPLQAGLGMLGFLLMDLGFDCSNSFLKAFVVRCSPRTEQTSLILLGVIMGSMGGVMNAALGVVDFTSLLGLSSVEGAKLTIQTSVQGLIIIVVILSGLLFTFCTGRTQLHQLQANSEGASTSKLHESSNETNVTKLHEDSIHVDDSESDSKPGTAQSRSSGTATFQSSIRSSGGNLTYMDPSVIVLEDGPPSSAEDVPLLEEDIVREEKEYGDHVKIGYGSVKPMDHNSQSSIIKPSAEAPAELVRERAEQARLSCLRNPKIRIVFMCITTCLLTGTSAMYTFAISDFVAKAVYGGDPEAVPGSDALSRYQEGIQMASWALLLYFLTYLLVSIVHPTILACLGFRLEFNLLTVLLLVTMLVAGVTSRMEAVFVLSVAAGTHRTCYNTMPYAVTNDLAQAIAYTSSGRSPVSLAMSLVAASVPLGYCLLFSWVGAVEELTGDVSTPLWLGIGNGVLSIIAFSFVGKV